MITKEVLQKFIDENVDKIAEILPTGLKDSNGKWLLVCPVLEHYDLDFSKVKVVEKQPEVVEEAIEEVVEEKPKKKRSKKK